MRSYDFTFKEQTFTAWENGDIRFPGFVEMSPADIVDLRKVAKIAMGPRKKQTEFFFTPGTLVTRF